MEEGEDSREVFSYSDGEIFMSFPAKDSFQPKVTYTFYAADEDGKVFSQSNGTKIPFLTMSVEIKNSYEDPIALETVFPTFVNSTGQPDNPHIIPVLENLTEIFVQKLFYNVVESFTANLYVLLVPNELEQVR